MALLFGLLLPALYATFRLRLLNLSLDPDRLAVISQLQWLPLLFEVMTDSLIALLAFHYGAVVSTPQRLRARMTNAMWVVGACFVLVAILITATAPALLHAAGYQGWEPEMAARFLRWEAWSQLPAALVSVLFAALVAMGATRALYAMALAKLLLAASCDALLIPLVNEQASSVLWVPIASITASTFVLCGLLWWLRLHGLAPSGWPSSDGVMLWLRRSGLAALECALRNAVFALMVLRLVNISGNATLFWATNGFIWSWLLLPALALGMLVQRDAGNHRGQLGNRLYVYVGGMFGTAALWMATLPLWSWFIANALGFVHAEEAAALAQRQAGFYLVFAISHVFTQYFRGSGRTGLLLVQTAIVNLGYYGVAFVLWQQGIWSVTLDNVVRLFGWGMVVGLVVLLLQYTWVQRQDRGASLGPWRLSA
jgi:Na+-driven multidrug efflux pump